MPKPMSKITHEGVSTTVFRAGREFQVRARNRRVFSQVLEAASKVASYPSSGNDAAQEMDRDYFKRKKRKRAWLRRNLKWECGIPEADASWVLVVQIEPGVRVRGSLPDELPVAELERFYGTKIPQSLLLTWANNLYSGQGWLEMPDGLFAGTAGVS